MADNERHIFTIYLQEARNARAFDPQRTLFPREFERARDLILRQANEAREGAKGNSRSASGSDRAGYREPVSHQHQTITILGPRGAGKTSMVLSLLQYFEEGQGAHAGNGDPRIVALRTVDPTLMEDTDVFLSVIVSNILGKVEEGSRRIGDEVRQKLEQLAKAMAVLLPQDVQREHWKGLTGDPLSLAQELLEKSHSGITLAAAFRDFVLAALRHLDADAFLQPIDDVDTAIDRAWPIPPCVRIEVASPWGVLSENQGAPEGA